MYSKLQDQYRYVFSDSLPLKERNTHVYASIASEVMVEAYAIKLIVPVTTELGKLIAYDRKERDHRTSKSARARAKARTK